jgi:hypothetical protein
MGLLEGGGFSVIKHHLLRCSSNKIIKTSGKKGIYRLTINDHDILASATTYEIPKDAMFTDQDKDSIPIDDEGAACPVASSTFVSISTVTAPIASRNCETLASSGTFALIS